MRRAARGRAQALAPGRGARPPPGLARPQADGACRAQSGGLREMISTKVAAAALFFAAQQGQAQVDVAVVDRLANQAIEQKRVPGISIGIMQDGRVVLAKGYGVASLETRVPVDARTIFAAGSITKQFTCVLALKLA